MRILVAILVLCAACSSKSGGEQRDEAVCARESRGLSADGAEVIFCDEAFAERPLVRPPRDDLGGTTITLFAALTLAAEEDGRPTLTLRDGTDLRILDAQGQLPTPWSFDYLSKLAPSALLPSHRNLFTIYRVRGEKREMGGVAGILLSEMVPFIILRGTVIDGTFRVFEGLMAPATGNFADPYDWTQAKPFRATLAGLEPDSLFGGFLPSWGDGGATLKDGDCYDIELTLANMTAGVTASDGACLPPLNAGDFNPVARLTSAMLGAKRFPSMHTASDQVWTFGARDLDNSDGDTPEGMSPLQILHPAAFLQSTAHPRFTVAEFFPHGYPLNIAVRLRVIEDEVAGSGEPCVPTPDQG